MLVDLLMVIDPGTAMLLATLGSTAIGGLSSWLGINSQKSTNRYNAQAVADTNATNMEIARYNNRIAMQQFLQQREDNRKYFDDTMAYNSADAQVDRLRKAGLNPSLAMYQGVSAGNVSASSSPAPPQLHTPTLQVPTVQPVDYSGLSRFAQQSLDTLLRYPAMLDAYNGIPYSKQRAKAKATAEVSDSVSKEIAAQIQKSTRDDVVETAKSQAESARNAAEISKMELSRAKYEAVWNEFKSNALGSLSAEETNKLASLFKEDLFAKLSEQIMDNDLTAKQIAGLIKDNALKQLEFEKAQMSKGGYEEMKNLIDSIDWKFGRSLLRLLLTYAMDVRGFKKFGQ